MAMEILVQALSLVAVIAVGQFVRAIGWVSAEDFPIFSHLVIKVTLPAALIVSFNQFELTGSLLILSVIGFALTGLQMVIGRFISPRGDRIDRAFSVMNSGSYNVGAFAVPYLAGIAGPQAVVYASMFDVGNVVNAAGFSRAWAISLAAPERAGGVGTFLQRMFSSVIFDVYIALVIMRLLDLHVPAPVLPFIETVAAANTFLAMLMIGIGLKIVLVRSKYLAAAKHLAVRYGTAVLAGLATWYLLPAADEVRAVLCAMYFAPLASMIPGFTHEIRGDVQLSSFIASASILVAVVVMPVLLLVLL